MDYDELIEESIRNAVNDIGQGESLADMLVQLFNEISTGNETLEDKDTSRRRCEILYETTLLNGS